MPNHHTLVIVESPAKCKKIEDFLGQGFKCVASFGHLRQLPHIKNIAIADGSFAPKYEECENKKKHIAVLKQLASQSDRVVLATDSDREGEAIAWHLCQILGLSVETTERIVFSEITRDAILNAMSTPKRINMSLVRAQQGRQILDVLVGFTISPHLWKAFSSGKGSNLSAGRCQTPALRLIYENYLAAVAKDGEKTCDAVRYRIVGHFTEHIIPFVYSADLTLEQTEPFLEKNIRFAHQLTVPEPPETVVRPAPAPLTTTSLLQAASTELRMSSTETMRYAQILYEQGRITYMRTEGHTFSREFVKSVHDTYKHDERIGIYLSPLPSSDMTTAAPTTDPHEPIRPVDITYTTYSSNTEEISQHSDTIALKRLYALIWRKSLQACMQPAQVKIVRALISAPTMSSIPIFHAFKHTSENTSYLGWKAVSPPSSSIVVDNDGETEDTNTDAVAFRYLVLQHYKNATMRVSFSHMESTAVLATAVSRHLTEARLIQMLKDRGIGRPSTYAEIVDKIQVREYVRKQDIKGVELSVFDFSLKSGGAVVTKQATKTFGNEKNKLVIQPLGCMVARFCVKFWPVLFAYEYTSNMEKLLDDIASNAEDDWRSLCRSCMLNMNLSASDMQDIATLEKLEIPLQTAEYGGSDENGKANWKLIRGSRGPVILNTSNKQNPCFITPRLDLCLEDVAMRYAKGQSIWLTDVADAEDLTAKHDACIQSAAGSTSSTEEISGEHGKRNTGIVRVINKDISIRAAAKQGWSDYILYKTARMKKARLISLGGFCDDYHTCDEKLLIDFAKNYVQPRRRKK